MAQEGLDVSPGEWLAGARFRFSRNKASQGVRGAYQEALEVMRWDPVLPGPPALALTPVVSSILRGGDDGTHGREWAVS